MSDIIPLPATLLNTRELSKSTARVLRDLPKTDPLGNITRWTYDTESNVLTETRPDGGVTRSEYDAMDRLIQTTDPKGQITRLTYTGLGSVASMTDPRGHTYSWIHDPLERPARKTYPGGSFELYSYDSVGNPVSYTTRAGQIRTSVFDRRDRETQTLWSDATPDITRTFDAAGRVLSEDNGAVTLTYTYNPANQVLSETTQVTGQPARTVGYAYDAGGRLASTTYPGGNVVTQTYTPRGQIAGIALDAGSVASYEYNPVGATTAKVLENGMTALYRYDAAQRLVGLEHRKGLDLLAKIDYTLDSVGNRRSKTQSGINPLAENYNYDAVDQLIEAQYGTARTVGYQYDAAGNRQTVNENGGGQSYTANADNAYTSVGGQATSTDLNGNMVSVPGAVYSYDAQNRLVSATLNGATTSFTYDARNRVVRRTSGNGTLNLTYSGWNLIEERNATGALEQVYMHGAGIDEMLVKITTTGQALDKVRKDLARQGADLRGGLWALRGNAWTRNGEQQQRRAQLMAAYPALGRAVALREYLQDALASGEPSQLASWLAWAERSRLDAFRDLARTLKRHREGVLAYMETKLTNGLMEAVNGLLQLAKRIARGFRNFHYFRLAAYLKAGGLNLQAPRLLPT